jgi:hypothetical protein
MTFFAALDIALPVFPCRDTPKNKATDKTPLTKNGFYDASTDPHKILEMFSHPCLVGVPTGAISGVDVLDVDPRNGGRDWYDLNKARLPNTRIHRTRSGGLHLLFKSLNGLKCSTGKIAPGIDVRAAGGYVIWWPASGYEFKDYPPAGLPEWPLWLLPAVMSKPTPPAPAYKAATHPAGFLAGIEGILSLVAHARNGERNQKLFWASCRLAEKVREGIITQGLADDLMLRAGAASGLLPVEIKATARNGRARA